MATTIVAAGTAIVPPIGSRVLVCGDMFDSEESHWQRSCGLGEFIDSDPPKNTVFFEGKVLKYVRNYVFQAYFLFDKTKINVRPDQVYKIIENETPLPEFWVFRPDYGDQLYRVKGVTFIKAGDEEIKTPQSFDSNNANGATPLSSPAAAVQEDAAAPEPPPQPRRQRRRRAVRNNVNAAPAAAVVAAPVAMAAPAVPAIVEPHAVRDGSESDDDFATDSDQEEASDYEDDEEVRWTPPKNWASLIRKTPELEKYGAAVWRVPADRGSLPTVHPQPLRADTFHIKPDGDRPLLNMYLDAFPIQSYWEMKKTETLRYAEQCQADPDYPGGARHWNPDWCTVPNLLRCAIVDIMRGLCPSKNLQSFFQGYEYNVAGRKFSRSGASEFLSLSLLVYEQLNRFSHLANNEARPARGHADYDKCYLVRPTIEHGQSACKRWCTPGTDSALDEGGLPSRHNWLRKRDQSKPHTYFIELLMACCSETRFCHSFFVNEGKEIAVLRPNRRPGQSKYIKVPYKQNEFNAMDWEFSKKFGIAAGHMHYFARKLREFGLRENDHVYNLHVDKRWDSVIGMVDAKKTFNISVTCSVKNSSRYHVANLLGVATDKSNSNRGKYRSATTTIDGVVVNVVQWMDSKLCGFASTQFGSAEMKDTRRKGRHKLVISCPSMVVERGQKFRAVDSNDQMRLSDVR